MLPDDYLRKMRQDLGEVEAEVEAETHYAPAPDDPPPPEVCCQLHGVDQLA